MAAVRRSALVAAALGTVLASQAARAGRSGESEFGDRSIATANDNTHLHACWDFATGVLLASFTPFGRSLVTLTGDQKTQWWSLRKRQIMPDRVDLPGWHSKWSASAVQDWFSLLSDHSRGSPKEHSVKPIINLFLNPIDNDKASANKVTSFGLAPDGKSFVTGHFGGRVIVRNTSAPHDALVEMNIPTKLRSFYRPSDYMCVGFSRDGKRVLAYAPEVFALLVFDAATGAMVSKDAGGNFKGCSVNGDMISDAAWSPDNERVALIYKCFNKHGANDGVIVFSATTGQKITSFSAHGGFNSRVAWDGEYVVTANRVGAVFWHGSSGVRSKLVPIQTYLKVMDFDIAPNGKYVVFALADGSGERGQLCFRSTKKKLAA